MSFTSHLHTIFSNRKGIEIETAIEAIINGIKSNKTVLFCGAGISRNSGIPIVSQIVPYILDLLEANKSDIQLLLNHLNQPKLPFEAFIEDIHNNCSILDLFDVFNLSTPNSNHFLIAKLAATGFVKTIVTTNFDKLIEKALEIENVNYNLYFKDDQFTKIDWDDKEIRLIKLHGSIDDKENIAITLRKVAQKSLVESRKKIIDKIFSTGENAQVLILGYSFSDVFDISPQIAAIGHSKKAVNIIDHEECSEKFIIKKILHNDVDSRGFYPFQLFSECSRISFDTNHLVKMIWESCLRDQIYEHTDSSASNWKSKLIAWHERAIAHKKDILSQRIIGSLLLRVSEFASAKHHFDKALELAKKACDNANQISLHQHLGVVCCSIGAYNKSIEHHKLSLEIAKENNDRKQVANQLGNIGVVYSRLHDFKQSIAFLSQSIQLLSQFGDTNSIAKELSNLGNIYRDVGNFKGAIELHLQALAIAQQSGDKAMEGNTFGNIANSYFSMSEIDEASRYFELSLEIAFQIGDQRAICTRLGNMASIPALKGDYKKAASILNDSLVIARQISDRDCERRALNNMAKMYCALGSIEQAIEYANRSFELDFVNDNKESLSQHFSALATIYLDANQPEMSLKCYKKAINYLTDIQDNYGLQLAYGNISNALCRLSRFSEGQSYCEKAIAICEKIGDKACKGSWYANLALISLHTYNIENAIFYYKESLSILRPLLGVNHPNIKLYEDNLRKVQVASSQYLNNGI